MDARGKTARARGGRCSVESAGVFCYNNLKVLALGALRCRLPRRRRPPLRTISAMSFPETRLTLIQRLASGGSEEDWRGFLRDYWGPVCRFALRSGARDLAEAEEIASHTFEVLWENRLLGRWVSNQAAKLRSLLCAVVRRTLSTRKRTRARRENARADVAQHIEELLRTSSQENDVFYAAWVEDVMQEAVGGLAVEYCRKNQGDRIRVLYGRVCEGLTIAEVGEALDLKASTVDFYFRDARDRLAERFRELVQAQVQRYAPPETAPAEFAREWEQLGQYLSAQGGLENALRKAYELIDPGQMTPGSRARMSETAARLTSIRRPPPDATSAPDTT